MHFGKLIEQRWFLFILLFINASLVSLHIAIFLIRGRVPNIIYLDGEANIPPWWSSTELFSTGILMCLVAVRNFKISINARYLLFLSALFLAMAVDEVAGVHELVGKLIDHRDRDNSLFHSTGIWFIVLGVPAALLFFYTIFKISSLFSQVSGTRLRLAAGISILLAGATGVEMTSNFIISSQEFGLRDFNGNYIFNVALEEFLEMTGGSILLWASFIFARLHWSTEPIFSLLTPILPHEAPSADPRMSRKG